MLLAILLEMAAALPAWSQVIEKLPVSRADYIRWGKLKLENMSPDGRFVSFTMRYVSGRDTLFVKDVRNDITTKFAGGYNGHFTPDGYFTFQGNDSTLNVMKLSNGQRWIANDVREYTYSNKFASLLYYSTEDGRPFLGIKKPNQDQPEKLWDVNEYSYNENTGALLFTRKLGDKSELILSYIGQQQNKKVVAQMTGKFTNLVWEPSGTSAGFLQIVSDGASPVLHSYKISTGNLTTFYPDTRLPTDWKISTESYSNLKISQEGGQVMFKICYDGEPVSISETVQIWNAADKYLFPVHRRKDGGVKYSKLAVWFPKQDQFRVITDNSQSDVIIAGSDKYAILSAPEKYEPQWNYDAIRDFYIEDLVTGERKLLVEKQSIEWGHISVSPGSRFLSYFNKGDWWVYDLQDSSHTNVTHLLGSDFVRDDMDVTSGNVAYGIGGWTDNDKFLALYDKSDVWMYDTTTKICRRITKGKEEELVYRFALAANGNGLQSNYDGQVGRQLSGKELFLEIHGQEQTGYCIYTVANGCGTKVIKKKKLSNMIKGATTGTVAYVEQDFDMPPAIMISNSARDKKEFQSNPHHYSYAWGKSELITYRNSKGQRLHAALYYPAGYNPEIKYPMVVSIYDRKANLVHNYVSPSMENSDGFNAANLTASGYFVLMPDIAYEIGSPGYSATDCVVSVVKEVLAKGQVDPGRVGLIGHSYGGYETDFIITQTDIFAAAVAGAAITDLQSSYLYASWNYKKPNFWHYEYNQLRMGGSIYNNYLGFISNSPTYHAEKVNTPLLSWTGQNDMQVHYYQSIELYLAFRRLGKEHIMLIYPGQGHALADNAAQEDLTEKIEAWFGYHLKGDEKPKWCTADLPR
jgi:fermentation-respiration switch protein FrsA (DUF1100 family)